MLAGSADVALRAATAFRADIVAARPSPREFAAPVRVFYEVWGDPIFTVGGAHLISKAIAYCGGENVFAGLDLPAPIVSVEAVIAARPQVIVAGADDRKRPAWLDGWKRWPQLPAVAANRLAVVDANLLHRPGPRFARGVVELCAAIQR